MSDVKKRVAALEERTGGNLRTYYVVYMYDRDTHDMLPAGEQERKLAETQARAGPDDVILTVVVE